MASQHPCLYFREECEKISTDWCSLKPTAKALPLTVRKRTVATVSSARQASLFTLVVDD